MDDRQFHLGGFSENTLYLVGKRHFKAPHPFQSKVTSNWWSSLLKGYDLRIFVAEQALLQRPCFCHIFAFTFLHTLSEQITREGDGWKGRVGG